MILWDINAQHFLTNFSVMQKNDPHYLAMNLTITRM
jgi:hypothetical protein